ncbi:MAG TPA: HAD-IA family hydrolase [Pyrinomonadaceae bacterium]
MYPPTSAPKLTAIKGVIFDFGDTLVTLSPAREEIFLRASRSIGLELDHEVVRRAYEVVDFHNKYSSVHIKGRSEREEFYQNYNRQLCEAIGISSRSNELGPAIVDHFKQDRKWQLVPGALEVLRRLEAAQLPLGIAANWDSNLELLTEELGIRSCFSIISASQAAGAEKPDPNFFLQAAAKLAPTVSPDQIVYVGNEYRADVLGARAAGLTPVLIDRSGLYQHADCLRFTSLLDWLGNIQ